MANEIRREIRTTKNQPPRIVRGSDGEPKIVGYAARFNELSLLLGFFREKIAPGAFTRALDSSDVRGLFNHDPNKVLGRQSAHTIRLVEDEEGLRYEIIPPKAAWARDLIESIERGDVRESSFSFALDRNREEWDETVEPPVRTIHEVSRLYDVGPVTFAAYPTTTSAVRTAEQVLVEYRNNASACAGNTWSQRIAMRRRRLELAERS